MTYDLSIHVYSFVKGQENIRQYKRVWKVKLRNIVEIFKIVYLGSTPIEVVVYRGFIPADKIW